VTTATRFTVFDAATGRVLRAGRCSPEDAGLQGMDLEGVDVLVGAEIDGDTHYLPGGVPTLRPSLKLPTGFELEVDQELPIGDVPEGTEVWIDRQLSDTVDDTGLVLEFPVAGSWQVELRPPFPTRPSAFIVTVYEVEE
jgi:hypothetical protein